MKDGWYAVQNTVGRYWVLYQFGAMVLACSDRFRHQVITHPNPVELIQRELTIYDNGKEVK